MDAVDAREAPAISEASSATGAAIASFSECDAMFTPEA
jgi:hypothetical protein